MADVLPPIPYDKPQTSFEWIDWYTKLIDLINSGGTPHNTLPGLQGGTGSEYYHLTAAQHAIASNPPFPVGSFYFSDNSTNPATTLGYGTWVLAGAGYLSITP